MDATDVLIAGSASMTGLGLTIKFAKFETVARVALGFTNKAALNVAAKLANQESINTGSAVLVPSQSGVGAEIIGHANMITGSVAGPTEAVKNRITNEITK